MGVRVIPAAESSPVADPLEMGPPLSGERHDIASTAQFMGPACVAARREPFVLPERVLNTMVEARAPSTRRLYALKWSIFSAWCQNRDLDRSPPMCQWFFHFCRRYWINSVPHPPSKFTLQPKCAPIAGRSVGRDIAVTQFVRGARRMNPLRPRTVTPWDLPTVLKALKGPPFEPLESSSLSVLSLKTTLLLALASVKRVGDLQALSVDPACLEFGPNDSKVVLKPRLGYVPKVLSTPFRAQVITLSANCPQGAARSSCSAPSGP